MLNSNKKYFIYISLLLCLILILINFKLLKQKADGYIKDSFIITTNNFEIAQPDIYEYSVIWAGGNLTEHNGMHLLDSIMFFDNKTKEIDNIYRIEKGQVDEPKINKQWICWVEWRHNFDWSIYAYSRIENNISIIDSKYCDTNNYINILGIPRLSLSNNNYLSWIDADRTLKLHDLSTNNTTTIADIKDINAIPYLSDNYLVWSEKNLIYVYTIKKDQIDKVQTKGIVNYPKVNDEFLVWQENKSKLNLKSLKDEEEITIFEGDIFFYDIGENYIIWQSKNQIILYNINEKSNQIVSENGFLPYMRGKSAIYQINKQNSVFNGKNQELQVLVLK